MAMLPKILVHQLDNQERVEEGEAWLTAERDRAGLGPDGDLSLVAANQRVMQDWLKAIIENREPICSGYAGMKALEMVMAVFAAGLLRTRVELPLANRNHPLRGDARAR